MLASLCSRDRRALSRSTTGAARTPSILLAAMAIPRPVPHARMPRSTSPAATARAHLRRVVGIVDRGLVDGAEILHLDAPGLEQGTDGVLQVDTRMIGAQRHAHRGGLYYTHSARFRPVHPYVSLRRLAPPSDRRHLPQGGGPRARRPSLDLPLGRHRLPRRSRRRRRGARQPRRAARPCAVVQRVADHAADADPRRDRRRSRVLARAARDGDRGARTAAARRDGGPARARRGRPAAVAHRRPLCRRARRADAVAGHRGAIAT